MKKQINEVLGKLTNDPELQKQIRSLISGLKEKTEDYYRYKKETDADRKRRSREQKKNSVKAVFPPIHNMIDKLSGNDKKQVELFLCEVSCKVDTINSLNNLSDPEKTIQKLIDECIEKYTKMDLTKKVKDSIKGIGVLAKVVVKNAPLLFDRTIPFEEQISKYKDFIEERAKNLYSIPHLKKILLEAVEKIEYKQKHGEELNREVMREIFTPALRHLSDMMAIPIEFQSQLKPSLRLRKGYIYYDIRKIFYALKENTKKNDHYLCKHIAKLFELSGLKTLRGEEYNADKIRNIIKQQPLWIETDAIFGFPSEFFDELKQNEKNTTN